MAWINDEVWPRGKARATVFVGATEVRLPVVDLLREHVRSGEGVAVWNTYGDQRTESWEGNHLRVSLGKSHMVSRLQALLGTGRLHLPGTLEAVGLTEELLDFELRANQNEQETSGAFQTGTHDDLVCAVGLATQIDPDRREQLVLQEVSRDAAGDPVLGG